LLKSVDCSRGPFTGRKALHAGLNCGINEVLLGDVARVRLRDDEREHCVNALQNFCQLTLVFVTRLSPCDAEPGFLSGDVLFMSVSWDQASQGKAR
jgi:hypothetical protein